MTVIIAPPLGPKAGSVVAGNSTSPGWVFVFDPQPTPKMVFALQIFIIIID